MNYFDFHCHLQNADRHTDGQSMISAMADQKIGACIIGVDAESSRQACICADAHAHLWCCIGQHPVDNRDQLFDSALYTQLVTQYTDTVVGIGECGLDYYWLDKDVAAGTITTEQQQAEKQRQKQLFVENIKLAEQHNLPLMLHVRSAVDSDDAHRDVLDILQAYPSVRAVFHFYTGSPELTRDIIARGYYISLPGVITFASLDETVAGIPLDRMFAETDTPYAAPVPYRGKTNCPLYVSEVYKKIAEIHNVPLETVRDNILANVKIFYGIDW